MATCFKGAMVTVFPSMCPWRAKSKLRRSAINARSPSLPYNPNDSFLRRLTSSPPRTLADSDPDSLPYVDLLHDLNDSSMTASPSEVESPIEDAPRPRGKPAPDVASQLFYERIVYIGLPLVPSVTELILAEFVYLQYCGDRSPIQLYVNSSGTATDDGERVSMEYEGFALYDALDLLDVEKRTLAIGCAMGMGCLLVAAGTRGKRCMMPHAHLAIKQPRLPPSGLVPAKEVLVRAREAIYNWNVAVELFARHTGNSVETVAKHLRYQFSIGPVEAKKFGLIDRIIWKGREDMMKKRLPPSEWEEAMKDIGKAP